LLTLPLLAGCLKAPLPADTPPQLHYPHFSGRLAVIEPQRRLQVAVQWDAERAGEGFVRLSDALTATVVELRWQNARIELRDNRAPQWRAVAAEQLAAHGIVLAPQELAALLLGQLPADLRWQRGGWERRLTDEYGERLLRIEWDAQLQRLTLRDAQKGRMAILTIDGTKAP